MIPRVANVVITFGTVNRELFKCFSRSPEGVGMITRVLLSPVTPMEVTRVANRVVGLVLASLAKVEVCMVVGLDLEPISLILLGEKLMLISPLGVELTLTVRFTESSGEVATDVDAT